VDMLARFGGRIEAEFELLANLAQAATHMLPDVAR
jgi:hypothetical protein